MKLLTAKKRKIAVLFTGGLGDSLLFVPLLKSFKRKEFHITCVFYSTEIGDCLYDDSLYNNKIYIRSKAGLIYYALRHIKQYVNFYINHLGKGRTIRFAARVSSHRITQTGGSLDQNKKHHRWIPFEPDLTDAEQNLRLVFSFSNAQIVKIQEFQLERPQKDRKIISHLLANDISDYFIIQVSAGNNKTPHKNWPIQNWIELVKNLCKDFPNQTFVIVGDVNEMAYVKDFDALDRTNCCVLIGKTSIREVFNLVAFSNGYIGLDSGIMHMAVVLQKKTLTIFGASNEKLYGYARIQPSDHRVITAPVLCRPCSSWIGANISRIKDPLQCPDFACLTQIKRETVYNLFHEHFKPL